MKKVVIILLMGTIGMLNTIDAHEAGLTGYWIINGEHEMKCELYNNISQFICEYTKIDNNSIFIGNINNVVSESGRVEIITLNQYDSNNKYYSYRNGHKIRDGYYVGTYYDNRGNTGAFTFRKR